MEKENVLEFEIIKTNDFGIIGMLKQNTKILKRSKDTEYSRSYNFPSWDFINKKLYTYGDEKYDNLIFTVPREDIALFLDKINCINEKYGIPKRWRAEEGKKYFSISMSGLIELKIEVNDVYDKLRYDLGNYFKTREEVKKVIDSNDWQELWAKVRAGEIGGENVEV
ncbi:hypothetical protein KST88_02470 [Fusobacterium nucleatum]|uniref:hypothetical protein n=1 Tax=Fusobacterium nucleatum TaxID=851 RepID=UPI0030D469D1